MKHVCMSTAKDPENRSKKKCCCGGHSSGARKPKGKDHRATPMATLLAALPDTGLTHGRESNEAAEHVANHPEDWKPL